MMNGILLAGGRSTRMGQDKRRLRLLGVTLLELALGRMLGYCRKVLVVVEDEARWRHLSRPGKVEVMEDLWPGHKALGGICTGIVHSDTLLNFVAACDMPFLSCDLIRRWEGLAVGYDWVLPTFRSQPQPLCAIYSRHCIPVMKTAVEARRLRVLDLIVRLRTRIVPCADGDAFLNINTPRDYRGAMALCQEVAS